MPTELASIESIVIDIDGVLWRGDKPLPGVAEFFGFLKTNAIRFLVVTNNATRTPEAQAERLRTVGVDISPDRILTSAIATLIYLKKELPAWSHLLVVGEAGLTDTLSRGGFVVEQIQLAEVIPSVAAVVVGLDRDVNYKKLTAAFSAIRAGARFVATNTDTTFPTEVGLVPGAGAIVAAVEASTSTTPVVIGKPHRPMFEAALGFLQSPPERTAMLGDRLDTDIQGAQVAGFATILVLTGVTTVQEARVSRIKPDYCFSNLIELMERWEADLEKMKAQSLIGLSHKNRANC